jgi:uncharacterized protein (TIGR02677 family)
MHYQLDKDSILDILHRDPFFAHYDGDQLILDLSQLVEWKNLSAIQDPHKTYTIADFKNRQYQYMMTETALEVERMTVTLENLHLQTAGLSSSAFRRIKNALASVPYLDQMSLKEVGEWWQELEEDFRRLRQNHQDYLREFYVSNPEKQRDAAQFVQYKQHLVRYLEDFIQELQSSVNQIRTELEGITSDQVDHMLSLVYQSALEVPRAPDEQQPQWKEQLRLQEEGMWSSLMTWFTGENSTASQVLDVTNEVIRRVVQNAAMLVQMQNMGVSNKAELCQLMTIFSGFSDVEEAHRLSALVFGAQRSRHFVGNQERITDRFESTYQEPPMDNTLSPKARTYKPRMDRCGFSDKRKEKAAQRRKILAEEKARKAQIMAYIREGTLDFSALTTPVSPELRTIFLSWVALANVAPDHTGYTQYGQKYTLRFRGNGGCTMKCTDGTLTMPDCVLIFEEEGHE